MIKQSFYNILAKLFSIIIYAPAIIIMAQILSKNDFGLFQQIIFIITFLGSLFRFSFDEGIIYFFNFKKEKQYDYLLQSYNFLLITGFIICLLASLPTIFFPNLLVENEILTYSKPIIIYIFLLVTGGLVSKIFIVEEKAEYAALHSFLFFFSKAVAIVVSLFFNQSIEILLNICIVINFFNSLFCFNYIKSKCGLPLVNIDFEIIYEMLSYNIWLTLSWFISTIERSGDKILLILLFTSTDYAIYNIGGFRIPLIFLTMSSISEIFLNKISEFSRTNDLKKIYFYYNKQIKINIIYTFPILLLSYYLIDNILFLFFGLKYQEGLFVFYILNIGSVVQIFCFDYLFRGLGKTKAVGVLYLLQFIFFIILLLTVFKENNIINISIALTTSIILFGSIKLFLTKNYLNMSISHLIPVKYLAISIFSSLLGLIVIYPIKFIALHPLISLIMNILIYFIVIFLLYKKMGIFKFLLRLNSE
jgi:O-antigen/teichoic acid export membrane protein